MDDDLIIDGENNTISFAVCDTACITIDDTLRSKFKRIKIINYHCESGNADALYSRVVNTISEYHKAYPPRASVQLNGENVNDWELKH